MGGGDEKDEPREQCEGKEQQKTTALRRTVLLLLRVDLCSSLLHLDLLRLRSLLSRSRAHLFSFAEAWFGIDSYSSSCC